MKTIWKFPLDVKNACVVLLPKDAEILTIQVQDEMPCLWAIVDSEAPMEQRIIEMFGTGNPMTGGPHKYISTFQLHGGQLVFHAFEYIGL